MQETATTLRAEGTGGHQELMTYSVSGTHVNGWPVEAVTTERGAEKSESRNHQGDTDTALKL